MAGTWEEAGTWEVVGIREVAGTWQEAGTWVHHEVEPGQRTLVALEIMGTPET